MCGDDFEGECFGGASISDPSGADFDVRDYIDAVWTGTEMIVWGGSSEAGWINTGGRYDPVTDTWRPMSTDGAPVRRGDHSAVWTGAETLVWGGWGPVPNTMNPRADGARYDPVTDQWRPMAAGGPRGDRSSAVWTGSEMIFWSHGGGRYDPVLDLWRPVCVTNAPESHAGHTAIWTGSEMIIWGGITGGGGVPTMTLGSGAIYDPVVGEWTTMAGYGFYGTAYHSAIWTGTTMINFGGESPGGFDGYDITMIYTP